MTLNLTNHLTNSMKQHIPHKTITVRPKDKPRYTLHVRKLYRQLHKLFLLKNRTNSPTHLTSYKNKRHEAKTAFRQARKDYFDSLSDNILNPETTPKTFWKLVKSVYNNNNQSNIPILTKLNY